MIDTLTNILGYTGTDITVTYIIVCASVAFTICIAYKFLDFLFSVVSALLGGSDKFKF